MSLFLFGSASARKVEILGVSAVFRAFQQWLQVGIASSPLAVQATRWTIGKVELENEVIAKRRVVVQWDGIEDTRM